MHNHLFTHHKKEKQNLVEKALKKTTHQRAVSVRATLDFTGLENFLEKNYNFTNVTPVISYVYNVFLTADISYGPRGASRAVFIKTGRHPGLYENEFVMGKKLYDANPKYFLEPICFNDYGKYNFFATEYATGETLETVFARRKPSAKRRAAIIKDIYHIFLEMKSSDVVHRDIRPANIMLLADGRTVLIDFQLAVSKSNYTELDYCHQRPSLLRNLGGNGFRYKPFTWDDAYSLMRVIEFIGRNDVYGSLYDTVHARIKMYIGKDTIKSSVRETGIHRMARHIHKSVPRRPSATQSL